MQRGLTGTSRAQNDRVASSLFAPRIQLGQRVVKVEVVHAVYRGLQRHDRRTVTQRVAVLLARAVGVHAEQTQQIPGCFGHRARAALDVAGEHREERFRR